MIYWFDYYSGVGEVRVWAATKAEIEREHRFCMSMQENREGTEVEKVFDIHSAPTPRTKKEWVEFLNIRAAGDG